MNDFHAGKLFDRFSRIWIGILGSGRAGFQPSSAPAPADWCGETADNHRLRNPGT
jgi:hypothetical protein